MVENRPDLYDLMTAIAEGRAGVPSVSTDSGPIIDPKGRVAVHVSSWPVFYDKAPCKKCGSSKSLCDCDIKSQLNALAPAEPDEKDPGEVYSPKKRKIEL